MPNGIYEKAKTGIIPEFTGISAPYGPLKNPDLVIQSYKEEAKAAAERVVRLLEELQII